MSTCNSSVLPSGASGSNNIGLGIPSNGALMPTDNSMEISLHQSNAKQGGAPEPVKEAAMSKGTVQLNSQATPAAGSGLTCDPTFDFSDANIQIRIGNLLFRIHRFKLYEFDHLKSKVEQAVKDGERKMIELEDNADDFHNLLVVLYSSVHSSHVFSNAMIVSTLKLATKYGHPTLRTFAIKELEKRMLEPIDQFAISRDCGITEWMPKAIDDLCGRDKSITLAEAQILGTEKFVELAARRERVKFERGSRVGLGSGQPIQSTDANLTTPSVPASQKLADRLVAPSTRLAAPSNDAQIAFQSKHHPATPTGDAAPVNLPVFGKRSNSPVRSQSAAPVLGFRRFGSGSHPFGFVQKVPQSPNPFQQQPRDLGNIGIP
ncbi:unnamed protein product [Rhizoctonia solani]|uniref:BTB domain-containing protein n=1 Tax=Rhizoctonia solani TaxID=456999 RepID=A0A8H3HHQ4_9AGAM|nr:unnamed protein product [Rhizoctonia solani]